MSSKEAAPDFWLRPWNVVNGVPEQETDPLRGVRNRLVVAPGATPLGIEQNHRTVSAYYLAAFRPSRP